MIKEKFTMRLGNEEVIDRKALCLAVNNSAKKESSYCSLLQDELKVCHKCSLLFKGNSNSYSFVGVSASKPNVKFGLLLKGNSNSYSFVGVSASKPIVKFELLLICDGIDEMEEKYAEDTEITVKYLIYRAGVI